MKKTIPTLTKTSYNNANEESLIKVKIEEIPKPEMKNQTANLAS